MAMCGVFPAKFSLHHPDVNLFHSSEWSSPATRPVWYLVYRVTLALLMLSGVLAHALSSSSKWPIYMTNQGITLLTIHYILYAFIVLHATLRPTSTIYGSLPFIYKLSWALQNLSSTCALFISIVYWTALHPYVVEYNLMPTAWMSFLNVFLHGLNSISFLIDIFVTARPIHIQHFYFAVLFGVYYMVFSLIYWQAGGTGRCAVRCWSVSNMTSTSTTLTSTTSTTTIVPSNFTATPPISSGCDEVVCDSFIYPILDWEDHPWQAVLIIVLGVLVMPLIQSLWWACYKLRTWLHRRCGGRREKERIGERIISYKEHQAVTQY